MLLASLLVGLALVPQREAPDGPQDPEPAAAPTGAWSFEGRVHDAFTGAALAGVHCELWTEDLYAEPVRVAEAWTGADGRYRLSGTGKRGEKLVLSRAGYRRTERGTPDEELALFPAREPFTLRVLDLDGNPIAGALVQTRQSCRHAKSAVRATSDADGTVTIADMPPFEDGGEVEVLAPGYGALGDLWPPELWDLGELRLPRRRVSVVRWLDADGRPVASGQVRYEGGDGSYLLDPDAEGRVTHDRLFGDRHGVVSWRPGDPKTSGRHLDVFPSTGSWSSRPGDPPEAACSSGVRLVEITPDSTLADGSRSLEPWIRLLHDEGWVVWGTGEHRVPPGRAWLVVGRNFSGVRERVTPVELATGETRELEAVLEPEPLLRLLVPESTWWIHVQAGDDSVTLEAPKPGAELRTPVPAGVPVTVLAQGRDVHRATLAPWERETTLDLTTPATRLVPERAERATVELRFRVRAADGGALAAEASARAAGTQLSDLDPAGSGVLFRVPEGARWEASFAAEGFTTLYRSGLAGPTRPGAVEEIRLPR